MMGGPPVEPEYALKQPEHRVTISKPYYMGIYEVTQAQYMKIMGVNPAQYQKSGSLGIQRRIDEEREEQLANVPSIHEEMTNRIQKIERERELLFPSLIGQNGLLNDNEYEDAKRRSKAELERLEAEERRQEELAEMERKSRSAKNVDTSRYPVEWVSWYDAVDFSRELSNLSEEKNSGRSYRLPTEAEWEYACRAGSTTRYHFGDDPDKLVDYEWFANNSGDEQIDGQRVYDKYENNPNEYLATLWRNNCRPHPVGLKKPNAWGLYDMHGNVLEWCADLFAAYSGKPQNDPTGPEVGERRVIRVGGWADPAKYVPSSARHGSVPDHRRQDLGFRVVLVVE